MKIKIKLEEVKICCKRLLFVYSKISFQIKQMKSKYKNTKDPIKSKQNYS